jgi:hypothetical protein
MSDIDVIEEVMRQVGYPDYPNLTLREEKEKKEFFEKLKEKIKNKELKPIEF